jgi:hypothetical protein
MNKGARTEDMSSSTAEPGVADLRQKLASNRMIYTFPPSLGICKSRSMVKNVYPSSSYKDNSLMVIHLNSGEGYVNPQTSYIGFQGGFVAAGPVVAGTNTCARFGVGSAANFFRSATLTSATGTEIERVEQVNLAAVFTDRYMRMDSNQLETIGRAQGYESKFNNTIRSGGADTLSGKVGDFLVEVPDHPLSDDINDTSLSSNTVAGDSKGISKSVGQIGQTSVIAAGADVNNLPVWVVPLAAVLGLFRQTKLLPSVLLSGARLEIQLESGIRSLCWDANQTTPSFQIINPYVMLDTYILEDSVLLALQKIAQQEGLEYVFSSVDTTQVSLNNNIVELDVRKALSIGNTILAVRHPAPADTDSTIDNFSTGGLRWRQWQFNLGSLYMPNQVMQLAVAPAQDTDQKMAFAIRPFSTEFYNAALYATEGYMQQGTTVRYDDYMFRIGCVGATLERSTLLSLSGMPVASARQLHLSARLTDGSSPGQQTHVITLFLYYTVLVKSFLDRTLVRI